MGRETGEIREGVKEGRGGGGRSNGESEGEESLGIGRLPVRDPCHVQATWIHRR